MDTKLEVLNLAATKHKDALTVPMSLKISLKGQWHTITVDREDKNVQKLVRVLVMMMIRCEIKKTSKLVESCQTMLENTKEFGNATLNDYVVEVVTGWANTVGPMRTVEQVTVRAHSGFDACVMALILKNDDVPKDATPEQIFKMTRDLTRLVKTDE